MPRLRFPSVREFASSDDCFTASLARRTRRKGWPRSTKNGRRFGRGSEMARIAFIGLGHMGGGMAPNLAKAGHQVVAFDLVPEAVRKASEAGCKPAESASQAVKE